MHNKYSTSPYSTQNRPERELSEKELRGELERLEKKLADGDMTVKESIRLEHIRKNLRKLGELKAGSMI